MSRKTVIVVLLVAALGAGIYWFFSGSEQGAQQAAPPTAVSAIRLERQTVDVSEEFPARTAPFAVSQVRPQVSGIVQKRMFTEGSRVSKGQQLYQIDPATYQATYNSAKATLVKAQAMVRSTQAKLNRYRGLVKIEAVSKQEFDDTQAGFTQAQADVGVAQAQLAQAKINLDYTKVYAPIDGRISKSSVTPGALVDAQQADPLAIITQLHPMYVDITQPSEDMQRLRAALKGKSEQKVTLIYKNGESYARKGALQFTDITVDPTTSSVQMRALFDNPDADLLPGLFVRAKLDMTEENALLVPQKATTRNADGSLSVWRIGEDDTVQPATITTRRALGDQWIVATGLEAGDRIVLEGTQKVQPGGKVSIADPAADKKAPEQPAPAAEPSEESHEQ